MESSGQGSDSEVTDEVRRRPLVTKREAIQRRVQQNINRLEELMPVINHLDDITIEHCGSGVEYAMGDTTAHGVGLLKKSGPDGIGVQDAFCPKGTFPPHIHDETEWLILYQGHITVVIGGVPHDLRVGDGIHIPSKMEHHVVILEDAWMIGITIPAEEAYPDAR